MSLDADRPGGARRPLRSEATSSLCEVAGSSDGPALPPTSRSIEDQFVDPIEDRT
jgi:hypothetical protein